jgi:predicted N-acetyltransferase YhbS
MPLAPWREAVLDKIHDRKSFDCGVSILNTYLVRYARQNQTAGVAKTFVAVPESAPQHVLGYYSLAPASIAFDKLPDRLAKSLPHYPIPAYLLARLAVDQQTQGSGLGGQLFFSAGERCQAAARKIGGVFMLINAKDEKAVQWYLRFGAIRSATDERLLIFSLSLIKTTLKGLKASKKL